MAKKNGGRKSKPGAVRVKKAKLKRPGRVAAASRPALDAAAMSYAKLIADPCSAPLVHPTYSGTEGGYLVRTESFYTIGTGTNETAGFLSWTPGLVGHADALVGSGAATNSTVVVAAALGANAPGYTFVRSNASNVRCVAACLKLSFPGAESARSGRIHFGHANGAAVPQGANQTPDSIVPLAAHFSRTPAQEIEIVWKPGDGDQLFRSPTGLYSSNEAAARTAIVVAWAGLGATNPGTGLTLRMTAIYEWQPVLNDGISVPTLSKSPSNSSLDQVINALIRGGFNFVRGLPAGGMTGGIMNLVAGAMGNMPALLQNASRTAISL